MYNQANLYYIGHKDNQKSKFVDVHIKNGNKLNDKRREEDDVKNIFEKKVLKTICWSIHNIQNLKNGKKKYPQKCFYREITLKLRGGV